MFIASGWRNTETGGNVQVSWGSIHERWKARRRTATRMSTASAVMRALQYSVVMKRELPVCQIPN